MGPGSDSADIARYRYMRAVDGFERRIGDQTDAQDVADGDVDTIDNQCAVRAQGDIEVLVRRHIACIDRRVRLLSEIDVQSHELPCWTFPCGRMVGRGRSPCFGGQWLTV